MTKKDYILVTIYVVMIITGILLKGYFGGFISGSFSSILLFVTIGNFQFKKVAKKMDANTEAMRRQLHNNL